MQFKLEPQSGYANSYLDVKFTLQFTTANRVEISLFNDSLKSTLEILGASDGYIEDNTLILRNSTNVGGYINLFNEDKLNKLLDNFISVTIKCRVVRYNENNEQLSIEEDFVEFYNQGKSLDSNIVPFDIRMVNANFSDNTPLHIQITCDKSEKYEICVRSMDKFYFYTFEVVTKQGQTDIYIPYELLWYDLRLFDNISSNRYDLYWVKFEGVNHLKTMNRNYIKIDHTSLVFNSNQILLQPTLRSGPTSKDLPDSFVLSHRYFVHTAKPWSEYGGFISGYDSKKLQRLTMLWHESQNIDTVKHSLSIMSVEPTPTKDTIDHKQIRVGLWQQHQYNKQKTVYTNTWKKDILSTFAPVYHKNSIKPMAATSHDETSDIVTTQQSGCNCSRKKNS